MYLPGRRRKNIPRGRMSATANDSADASRRDSATVCVSRVSGSGFTRDGGSSAFDHAW